MFLDERKMFEQEREVFVAGIDAGTQVVGAFEAEVFRHSSFIAAKLAQALFYAH